MNYFFKSLLDFPRDFYRKCKRGYQRAYRGWSDEDCWGFSSYISDVIIGGLKWLKENKHGYPVCCEEDVENYVYSKESEERSIKKWDEILDTIIWTFETTKKIQDNNWIYCYENEYFSEEELIKWNKFCDQMQKEFPEENYKVMTKLEVDKFRLGFKYFQQYYWNLWD